MFMLAPYELIDSSCQNCWPNPSDIHDKMSQPSNAAHETAAAAKHCEERAKAWGGAAPDLLGNHFQQQLTNSFADVCFRTGPKGAATARCYGQFTRNTPQLDQSSRGISSDVLIMIMRRSCWNSRNPKTSCAKS